MRIVAISNQKGGVGKTTTAIALACGLADTGYRVVLIDMDPQSNATSGIGFSADRFEQSIYDALVAQNTALEDMILPTNISGLDLLPASRELAAAELEMVSMFDRESRLKDLLEPLEGRYDFAIIDTPPTLGLLTVNALTASHFLIVPMQCEYFAMEGLSQLKGTVELLKKRLNPNLKILGILLTMFDKRNNLSHQVASEIDKHFGNLLFQSRIPRNVKISEASSYGLPIQSYAPRSRGACAYDDWVIEVVTKLGFDGISIERNLDLTTTNNRKIDEMRVL